MALSLLQRPVGREQPAAHRCWQVLHVGPNWLLLCFAAFLKALVTPAFTAVPAVYLQELSKYEPFLLRFCYDGVIDAGPGNILMVGIGILLPCSYQPNG